MTSVKRQRFLKFRTIFKVVMNGILGERVLFCPSRRLQVQKINFFFPKYVKCLKLNWLLTGTLLPS